MADGFVLNLSSDLKGEFSIKAFYGTCTQVLWKQQIHLVLAGC